MLLEVAGNVLSSEALDIHLIEDGRGNGVLPQLLQSLLEQLYELWRPGRVGELLAPD
jgi:hypothetical protein